VADLKDHPKPEPLKELPALDFRAITRDSDKVQCEVELEARSTAADGPRRFTWITCGDVTLNGAEGGGGRHRRWRIGARFDKDVTDDSHDSAWAFHIPLIGVEFEMVEYSTTFIRAFIDPEWNPRWVLFRVPRHNGWPKGAERCDLGKRECGRPKGHLITRFMPEFDAELFKLARGRPVWIRIHANREAFRDGGDR
jgi:hypothetical protein